MPFIEVGAGSQRATGQNNNVALSTKAYPADVLSGSLLITAGVNFNAGGAVAVAVTDTRSTSYTVLSVTSGNFTFFIAYGIAPSAGANTVTVDPAGTGNYVSYSIDEFSGVNATPLDVDGASSTGTSTTPSDGITTITADDLLIGVMGFTDAAVVTINPGGDYTQIGEHQDNSSDTAHSAVFRLVTTAQAYTVDWTLGTSSTWYALTAAFRPVPSANAALFLLLRRMMNG